MVHPNVSKSIFQTPDYLELHPWEKFDTYPIWQSWMEENWTYSFYFVFSYVFLLFAGREWMKWKKEPYKLKTPLFLWNAGLALFSLMGFLRTYPELTNLLSKGSDGFYASCCLK